MTKKAVDDNGGDGKVTFFLATTWPFIKSQSRAGLELTELLSTDFK